MTLFHFTAKWPGWSRGGVMLSESSSLTNVAFVSLNTGPGLHLFLVRLLLDVVVHFPCFF